MKPAVRPQRENPTPSVLFLFSKGRDVLAFSLFALYNHLVRNHFSETFLAREKKMDLKNMSEVSRKAIEQWVIDTQKTGGVNIPKSFLIEAAITWEACSKLFASGVPLREKAYPLLLAKRLFCFASDFSVGGCPFRERTVGNPAVDICTFEPD